MRAKGIRTTGSGRVTVVIGCLFWSLAKWYLGKERRTGYKKKNGKGRERKVPPPATLWKMGKRLPGFEKTKIA